MTRMIRATLIAPASLAAQELKRHLNGVDDLWLGEVCTSYEDAGQSIAAETPDLIVIDVDPDPEAAIALIRKLIADHPGVAVLPASSKRDGALILRLVRAGVREFLGLPATLEEVIEAVDRLVAGKRVVGPSNGASRVIAIAGASGGVGCTTLAVNLGTALAKLPKTSVALADFDLLLGSVGTCLDIVPDRTVLDVATEVDRIDLTLLRRSLTSHSSGLQILPRPLSMEDVGRIDPEGLRRVVKLLRAAFQVVLIDTSKGMQAWDFVALESADVILLVVQLDPVGLHNVARLLTLLRHQFAGLVDRVKVVANRTGVKQGEISVAKAESVLGLPISWTIPNDHQAFLSARAEGVTIDRVAQGAKCHAAILKIAGAFASSNVEVAPKRRSKFAAFFF